MIRSGVDIVHIPRIARLMGDQSFLDKVFLDSELASATPGSLAGIFAAKEAFFKATQISYGSLKEIEVSHDKDRKPVIRYDLSRLRLKSVDCSISHDGDYAIAFVVCEI